jgi:hypothetical protein
MAAGRGIAGLRYARNVGSGIERTATVAIVRRSSPFSPWEMVSKGWMEMDWGLALEFALSLGGHGTEVGLVNSKNDLWVLTAGECEKFDRQVNDARAKRLRGEYPLKGGSTPS